MDFQNAFYSVFKIGKKIRNAMQTQPESIIKYSRILNLNLTKIKSLEKQFRIK